MKMVAVNTTGVIQFCLVWFQRLLKGYLYAKVLLKHHGLEQHYHRYYLVLELKCDHAFESKCLVNELFKLGFSISYSEVNMFKESVVANQPMRNSVINVNPKVFTI